MSAGALDRKDDFRLKIQVRILVQYECLLGIGFCQPAKQQIPRAIMPPFGMTNNSEDRYDRILQNAPRMQCDCTATVRVCPHCYRYDVCACAPAVIP
jgi:hypothetical protein